MSNITLPTCPDYDVTNEVVRVQREEYERLKELKGEGLSQDLQDRISKIVAKDIHRLGWAECPLFKQEKTLQMMVQATVAYVHVEWYTHEGKAN